MTILATILAWVLAIFCWIAEAFLSAFLLFTCLLMIVEFIEKFKED